MKNSKTAIRELTARYRSVLLKCFAIAMAIGLSSGAMADTTTTDVTYNGDYTAYSGSTKNIAAGAESKDPYKYSYEYVDNTGTTQTASNVALDTAVTKSTFYYQDKTGNWVSVDGTTITDFPEESDYTGSSVAGSGVYSVVSTTQVIASDETIDPTKYSYTTGNGGTANLTAATGNTPQVMSLDQTLNTTYVKDATHQTVTVSDGWDKVTYGTDEAGRNAAAKAAVNGTYYQFSKTGSSVVYTLNADGTGALDAAGDPVSITGADLIAAYNAAVSAYNTDVANVSTKMQTTSDQHDTELDNLQAAENAVDADGDTITNLGNYYQTATNASDQYDQAVENKQDQQDDYDVVNAPYVAANDVYSTPILENINDQIDAALEDGGSIDTELDKKQNVIDATNKLSGTLITDGTVASAQITDGTIVDADIADNANIAQSKISGLTDALSNISVSTSEGVVSISDDSGVAAGQAQVYNTTKTDALLEAKLDDSQLKTLITAGSTDQEIASAKAVKSYTDAEIDAAIVNNANNTVTLTGNGTAQTVYDTTGTASYVTSNAEGANYTGVLADGTTSSGSIKAALNATNVQVKANTDKNTVQDTGLGNLASKIGVSYTAADGSVSATDYTNTNYVADGQSLVAAVSALDGALKNTDTIVGAAQTTAADKGLLNGVKIGADQNLVSALNTVATTAAGLSLDNTFTGANTFTQQIDAQGGIKDGNTSLVEGTLTVKGATGTQYSTLTDTGLTITNGQSGTNEIKTVLTNATVTTSVVNADQFNAGTSSFKQGNLTVDANNTLTTANGLKASQAAIAGDLTAGAYTDASSVAHTLFTADVSEKTVTVDGTLTTTGDATIGGALTANSISTGVGEFNVDADGNMVVGTTSGSTIKYVKAGVDGTLTTTGNATIGGALNVTGDYTSTDGDLILTNGDIKTTAISTSVDTNAVAIGGTSYTTTVTGALNVVGDETVKGTFGAGANGTEFTVGTDGAIAGLGLTTNATNGVDLGIAGTTTDIIGKDIGIAGTNTASLKVGSNGVAVNTTGTTVTGAATMNGLVTANAGLTVTAGQDFKLGGTAVNAINTGAASTSATTLPTMASVQGQAENATYTNTVTSGSNVKATTTTLGGAIADLDKTMGNIAAVDGTDASGFTGNLAAAGSTVADHLNAIDERMGQIDGLYDGSVVHSTVVRSTVNGNSNLANGSTVEEHLVSLDNAIGDRNYTSTNYIKAGASVSNALSTLDSALKDVDTRVSRLNRRMTGGFASLAAMSALQPNARAEGNTQISAGTGTYRGRVGMAVGAFHYINDEVMMNLGASYAGSTSATFRAGVTFGL